MSRVHIHAHKVCRAIWENGVTAVTAVTEAFNTGGNEMKGLEPQPALPYEDDAHAAADLERRVRKRFGPAAAGVLAGLPLEPEARMQALRRLAGAA